MSEGLTAFKAKLEEDGYAGITGARRAIGKTKGLLPGEADKAHKMANKYFDAAATPSKAPAKKAPKKAAKAAKAAKAKASKGPGPGRGRKKKTAPAAKAAAKAPKAAAQPTVKDVKAVNKTNEVKVEVEVGEKILTNIMTMREAGVDVTESLEMAHECFKRALRELNGVAATVSKKPAAVAAVPKGGNAQPPAPSPPPVGLPGAAALANPAG